MIHNIEIHIPEILTTAAEQFPRVSSDQEAMEALIEVSRQSLQWGLGGPFAAAILHRDSYELVSLGVNLVLDQKLSTLHAEMVAIMLAQRQIGHFDLATYPKPLTLFTSCEPCTMCLGASHWSGISKLVAGARDADAASAGFDEGPKPDDWAESLRARRITVLQDVCREAAAKVLLEYKTIGGEGYNSLRND